MQPIASDREANLTYFRVIGTHGCGVIPLPLMAYKFISAVRKVFKRAIVQETSFAYNKGESFFIFDHEASTVVFCNITFAYGSVSLKLYAQCFFSSIILLATETAGPDSTTQIPVYLHGDTVS
jgi:hypothetical protein